jgi:predicted nucleic acid-binding protein
LGEDGWVEMDKIYLDVCCLCRPFDDQTVFTIRQEAESVQEILRRCHSSLILVGSEMIDDEVLRIADNRRRELVFYTLRLVREYVTIHDLIKTRTGILRSYGFHAADAIHIASAEHAQATFLTTDKQILHLYQINKQHITVPISHPTHWLLGV